MSFEKDPLGPSSFLSEVFEATLTELLSDSSFFSCFISSGLRIRGLGVTSISLPSLSTTSSFVLVWFWVVVENLPRVFFDIRLLPEVPVFLTVPVLIGSFLELVIGILFCEGAFS